MAKPPKDDGVYKEIFCKYIIKNGKHIYPKNGKCFHFWVKVKGQSCLAFTAYQSKNYITSSTLQILTITRPFNQIISKGGENHGH